MYCDFYFVTTKRSHAGFLKALHAELTHYAHTHPEPLDTLYLGGGTPSLLHPDDLHRLIAHIHDQFDTTGVREITLELNPEDADLTYLETIRHMGINRLSIGIQSFFEEDLRFMNRSHSVKEAEAILPLAQKAGFDNLSVDLIFGIPDQPFEYWAANVQKALRLGAKHISSYSLTVEERTPLHNQVARGLVTPADDGTLLDRFRFTMDYLREQGWEHYEISSYAQPGYRSQHNQAYWTHANYLGVGPSAHAFWWQGLPAQRWANVRNLRSYEALMSQRTLPIDFRDDLGLDALANEYLMLRLRTTDGLDLGYFRNQYGADLRDEKADALAWLEEDGLIHLTPTRLTLTDAGKFVCDAVTEKLMLSPLARL